MVELEGDIQDVREKAIRFAHWMKPDGVWLPRSQVKFDEAEGTVTLPEWLAKNEGLV